MKIAHISDLHLTSLDNIAWTELLNKRILGYLSWQHKRRHTHKREILDKLLEFIRQDRPDLLTITGDLTHIGTAQEYTQVQEWLNSAAKDFNILLVPGNHDCYAAASNEYTLDTWKQFYPDTAGYNSHDNFPSVLIENNIALIGINTALPTAPFLATGKIGEQQLNRLIELLDKTKSQGLFRLLMLHHGPVPGTYKKRKRLVDEDKFVQVIKKHGAELILHGHGHESVENFIDTGMNKIPTLGVPSASALATHKHPGAGYNLYDIEQTEQGWNIQRQSLSLDMNTNSVEKTSQAIYSIHSKTV